MASNQPLGAKIKAHLVELETTHHSALQQKLKDDAPKYPSVEVTLLLGDFKEHSKAVFATIHTDQYAFCFIDPFGFQCVDLGFISDLMKSRARINGGRTELFITLMTRHLNWFLTDEVKRPLWDKIFGTTEWQKLANETHRIEKVVGLYCNQIQLAAADVGLKAWVYPIGIKPDSDQAEMYYLIHVGFHPKARLVMEQSVAKIPQLEIAQLDLFGIVPVMDEIVAILKREPKLNALELGGEVWLKEPKANWKDLIIPALKRLESDKTITVIAYNGRKRRDGIEEKDFVKLTNETK